MPSNLLATVMQDIRSQQAGLDRHETRFAHYGSIELMRKQNADGGTYSAEVQSLFKNAHGRAIQTPVLKKGDITIGNARSCSFPTGGVESAMVTLTSKTYSFMVYNAPEQYRNNEIGEARAIGEQIRAKSEGLMEAISADIIGLLDANKNTFWTGISGRYYTVDANTLLVPAAQADQLYNTIPSILEEMKYFGTMDILGQPIHYPLIRHYRNQGAGNDTNLAYQYAGFNFFSDRKLNSIARTQTNDPDGAGALTPSNIKSTMFAVAPGSIAMYNRTDPDSMSGNRIHDGKFWGIENNPYLGLEMGVFYQADCGDASLFHTGSSLSHLKRTKLEGWEFSIDVAYQTLYLSTPASDYAPIVKVEVLA